VLEPFVNPPKVQAAFAAEEETTGTHTIIPALGRIFQQLGRARQCRLNLSRPGQAPGFGQARGRLRETFRQVFALHPNLATLTGNALRAALAVISENRGKFLRFVLVHAFRGQFPFSPVQETDN
jgi:hypothetical protein